MPNYEERKNKKKPDGERVPVGKGDEAPFRGYINLNLSDEEKAAYTDWANSSSLWEALQYQVASGVNISVKRERKGEAFLASGTQRDVESPNAGLCVTARGKDVSLAWGRLLFCLTILTHSDRWEDKQPLADPDRW